MTSFSNPVTAFVDYVMATLADGQTIEEFAESLLDEAEAMGLSRDQAQSLMAKTRANFDNRRRVDIGLSYLQQHSTEGIDGASALIFRVSNGSNRAIAQTVIHLEHPLKSETIAVAPVTTLNRGMEKNVEFLLPLEIQQQAAIRSGRIEIRHLSGSSVSYRFASVILLSASQSVADQRNGAVTDQEQWCPIVLEHAPESGTVEAPGDPPAAASVASGKSARIAGLQNANFVQGDGPLVLLTTQAWSDLEQHTRLLVIQNLRAEIPEISLKDARTLLDGTSVTLPKRAADSVRRLLSGRGWTVTVSAAVKNPSDPVVPTTRPIEVATPLKSSSPESLRITLRDIQREAAEWFGQ